jgi:NAD(P)H-dependent FMN reductase
MRILAISGSLRAGSTNTALLRAAAGLAPAGLEIAVYAGLADLPIFNPDHDEMAAPQAVLDLRARLQTADGVLIACPEYAHGVPGGLKNALDWVVASGELVDKPVALFHTSDRGAYARAALTETLTVMSARIIPEASITVLLTGKTPEEIGRIVSSPEVSSALRSALEEFAQAIRSDQAHPHE